MGARGRGRSRTARTAAPHEAAQREPRPRPVPWTTSASLAYAEHDGVNRHGEGRPSNARWYQSTRRRGAARRSVHVSCSDAHRASRAAAQQRRHLGRQFIERAFAAPGRAPTSRWPWGRRAEPASARRRGPAAGGGDGCGRRRCRRRGRSRTPRAGGATAGRRRTGTRGSRCGRGGHGAAVARTLGARGSDRSSRQARAALEPAGLEDRAAGPRAHPGAEPVLAGPAAGVRLVGALHVRLRTGSNGGRRRDRPSPRKAAVTAPTAPRLRVTARGGNVDGDCASP